VWLSQLMATNVLTQALIYPLTVATKSALQTRHNAANKILKNMCEHSPVLVQQAMMVILSPSASIRNAHILARVTKTMDRFDLMWRPAWNRNRIRLTCWDGFEFDECG